MELAADVEVCDEIDKEDQGLMGTSSHGGPSIWISGAEVCEGNAEHQQGISSEAELALPSLKEEHLRLLDANSRRACCYGRCGALEHPVRLATSEDASSSADSTGWSSEDEVLHFPKLDMMWFPFLKPNSGHSSMSFGRRCHSPSLQTGTGTEATTDDLMEASPASGCIPVFAKMGWPAGMQIGTPNRNLPERQGRSRAASPEAGDKRGWMLLAAVAILGSAAVRLVMTAIGKQRTRDGTDDRIHDERQGREENAVARGNTRSWTESRTLPEESDSCIGSQLTEQYDSYSTARSTKSNPRSLPDGFNAMNMRSTTARAAAGEDEEAAMGGLNAGDHVDSMEPQAAANVEHRDVSTVHRAAERHSQSTELGTTHLRALSVPDSLGDLDYIEDLESPDSDQDDGMRVSPTLPCAPSGAFGTSTSAAAVAKGQSAVEAALQDRLIALHEELEESESRRHKALTDLAKLSSLCDGEANALRERLKEEQRHHAEMSHTLKRVRDERDALVSFMKDTRKALAGLEPSLVQACGRMDSLNDAIRHQQWQLHQAQEELQEAGEDSEVADVRVRALQHDVSCAERLLEALEALQMTNTRGGRSSLDEVAARLDVCTRGLRQDQPGWTSGRGPQGSLQPRIKASLDTLMFFVRQAAEDSNAQDDDSAGLVAEFRTVEREKRQLEAELASTRGDLGQMIRERGELEHTAAELEAAVHREMSKLAASQDHQYRLKKALDQAHQQTDEVQQMLEERERELAQMRESMGSVLEDGKRAEKQGDASTQHRDRAIVPSHQSAGHADGSPYNGGPLLQSSQEEHESEVQVLRADLEVAQSRYRALHDKCRQLESAQSKGSARQGPGESPSQNGPLTGREGGTGADSRQSMGYRTPTHRGMGYRTPIMNAQGSCYSADPFGQVAGQAWGMNIAYGQAAERVPSVSQLCPMGQRRASWPQDLSTALTDQVMLAAQEVMELTANSVEMANRQEVVTSELMEARRAASTTQQLLQERDATVSDLTEQFLQVYQIASDLATDNEQARNEVKELRSVAEGLKGQLAEKERRIAAVEQAEVAALLDEPQNAIDQLNILSSRSAPPQSTSPSATPRLAARAIALSKIQKRGPGPGHLGTIGVEQPVPQGTRTGPKGTRVLKGQGMPGDDVLMAQAARGLPVWQRGDVTPKGAGRRIIVENPRASTDSTQTVSPGRSSRSLGVSSRSRGGSLDAQEASLRGQRQVLDAGIPSGNRHTQSFDGAVASKQDAVKLDVTSGTPRSADSDASPHSSAAATDASLSAYVGGLGSTRDGASARSAFDGSDLSLTPKGDEARRSARGRGSPSPVFREEGGRRSPMSGRSRGSGSPTRKAEEGGRRGARVLGRGSRGSKPPRRIAAKAEKPWM